MDREAKMATEIKLTAVNIRPEDFDLVVRGLNFLPKDEWHRARYLSDRFTKIILRSPHTEFLFKGFSIGEEFNALVILDWDHIADFDTWVAEQLASQN